MATLDFSGKGVFKRALPCFTGLCIKLLLQQTKDMIVDIFELHAARIITGSTTEIAGTDEAFAIAQNFSASTGTTKHQPGKGVFGVDSLRC